MTVLFPGRSTSNGDHELQDFVEWPNLHVEFD